MRKKASRPMGGSPFVFFGVTLYQPRVTSWILEEANSKGQTVFHS